MGLFEKFRKGGPTASTPASSDLQYLRDWTASHTGVEAFVEPQTNVTEVTVVLVASDGEWTRRRAGGDSGAHKLNQRLGIPVYDVQKVGYPQRMRDFDAVKRIERRSVAAQADRSEATQPHDL